MTTGREVAARLKAQHAPKIKVAEVRCTDCRRVIGRDRRGLVDGREVVGPFELAKGMVPTGRRTFAPAKVNVHGGRRGGGAVVVNRPGPVAIVCFCGTTNTLLHRVGTADYTPAE